MTTTTKKKATSESKEVATKADNAVAAAYDYGSHAGAGFENVTSDDYSIPMINLLQALSPEVEDNDAANPGMFFNSVTKELVKGDEGFVFVPCYTYVSFVEWVPRENGGGRVGEHAPDSPEVDEAIQNNDGKRMGKLKLGENDLVETHYFFGLVLEEDGETIKGFGVVPFSSTKIKPKRDWLTAMAMCGQGIPLYAHRARITSKKQKKDTHTFYNVSILPFQDNNWKKSLINPETNKQLLDEGEKLYLMVDRGDAKMDTAGEEAANAGSGGDPVSAGDKKAGTPF